MKVRFKFWSHSSVEENIFMYQRMYLQLSLCLGVPFLTSPPFVIKLSSTSKVIATLQNHCAISFLVRVVSFLVFPLC